MNPTQWQHRLVTSLRPLKLALAVALACTAGLASAADESVANTRATTRAIDLVKAFPGRSGDVAGQTYNGRGVVVDADGAQHVRLERLYRGLRVIGGDLVVHSSAGGTLLGVSRSLQRGIDLSLNSRLSASQALAAALAHQAGQAQGQPEVVVYARGAQPVLAFEVRVFGERADQTPIELHVIVDANSGLVIDSWDDIETAPAPGTGNSLYLGAVPITTELARRSYTLKDTTRGAMSTVDMKNRTFGAGTAFTDTDNLWGNGTTSDRATVAVDAEFGVALTWDYYLKVHGRNGIANDGVGAQSRVHYGNNYANAFWSDSCFCMTFGDGSGSIKPLVSLDVAGHEMSHGVTSRTAGLIYSGESGGLNEATSDIFGTMVEYYANNASDPGDYLIGEKLFANGTSVIRNMMKPSVDGASADCYYPSVGNIDVHYSSGIANHFYFLLAEGTTAGQPSPTCVAGNTRVASGLGSLTGITRQKAEKIWYRALTVYMTTGTTYAQARAASLSAAADLYGAGSPEYGAVAAAWSAVLVN
jgi:Zn-dependent metalloprotease